MKRILTRFILLSLMASVGTHAADVRSAKQTYWAGHLSAAEFNFADNTVEGPGSDAGRKYQSASLTVYSYDVYQGPQGIVRHQLGSMNRNRGLEPGLDVQLISYAEGYIVSYNKGAKTAFRSAMPIPGGSTRTLEEQRILGYRCRGIETRWNDMNHYVVVVKTWSPTNLDFRDPLLQMRTVWDQTGRLVTIRTEAITDLQETSHLEDSLFRVPQGLEVKTVP